MNAQMPPLLRPTVRERYARDVRAMRERCASDSMIRERYARNSKRFAKDARALRVSADFVSRALQIVDLFVRKRGRARIRETLPEKL